MKICHLTSAHPQEDIRIFHKECVSLAKAGYDTYLISCGDSYEKFGVKLTGVGEQQASRKDRMLKSSKKVYNAAVALDADMYHFHDPELLPYGLRLKKAGKKVIFDSHEDVPAQILDKTWIPKPLRVLVSKIYKVYESYVVKHLDAVVAATPHIAESFKSRCKNVVVVNNYPKLDDIEFHDTPFSERDPIVCYAGGIDELRGENIMIEAMKDVDGQLIIAGDHEVMEVAGNIRYIGIQDRRGVNDLYGKARAGIVIYQPAANHMKSQPIKLFEFMAAGLPVIASNFPLWKTIIEDSQCGICVNPQITEEVKRACETLIFNPEDAEAMGKNGRRAVEQKHNWTVEKIKLLNLYEKLGE